MYGDHRWCLTTGIAREACGATTDMTELLAWLSALPAPLLYGAIALAAFAENIFPPLPADTVIALGVGAWRALIAMTLASGAWYGLVCVLAYRAGANADVLLARIAGQQRALAIGAISLVAVGALVFWLRHRTRTTRGARDE